MKKCLLSIGFFLLLVACDKDSLDTPPAEVITPSLIKQAKKYFEKDVVTQKENNNANPENHRNLLEKYPEWANAYVTQLSNGPAVVVPLDFPNEIYLKRNNGRISLPVSDLTRLLIYKDSGSQFHAEVVTSIPDENYVHNSDSPKLFSGIVLIEEWQGRFLKGFKYKTNEGTKRITSTEGVGNIAAISKNVAAGCSVTDWYTCVSSVKEGWSCHFDYTEVSCTGSGSGSVGGGGGWSTGSGGYGGPSSTDYSGIHGSGGGGGGGGHHENDNSLQQMVVLPADPVKIIRDPANYFGCFTIERNATYGIDIYVQEPKPGTRIKYNFDTQSVGHTFLTIWERKTNGTMIRRTVGFWPVSSASPLDPSSRGVIQNDQGHSYNVHVSVTTVNAIQIMDLINQIKDMAHNEYNLNSYNCTSFAIDALAQASIGLPKTQGDWLYGSGYNPADLGEDIRNNATIKVYQSGNKTTRDYHPYFLNAPLNQGSCN